MTIHSNYKYRSPIQALIKISKDYKQNKQIHFYLFLKHDWRILSVEDTYYSWGLYSITGIKQPYSWLFPLLGFYLYLTRQKEFHEINKSPSRVNGEVDCAYPSILSKKIIRILYKWSLAVWINGPFNPPNEIQGLWIPYIIRSCNPPILSNLCLTPNTVISGKTFYKLHNIADNILLSHLSVGRFKIFTIPIFVGHHSFSIHFFQWILAFVLFL